MQAKPEPAKRDEKTRDRPVRVSRVSRVAMPEGKPEGQIRGVVHHVVKIDAVQARRLAETRHLTVDVIKPKARVKQQHAGNEALRGSPTDRDRGEEVGHERQKRHLIG